MVKRASKVVDVEDKQIIEEDVKNYIEVIEKPPAKRRGRKPKGGKIVQNSTLGDDDVKS